MDLTLSPCCEGTPNLYAASSTRVDAGFHYQLRRDDFGSERLFLVDQLSGVAEQLELRTRDGSESVSNGTVELVEIGERPAVGVGVYVFSDGPQGGQLIYYRTLDGG